MQDFGSKSVQIGTSSIEPKEILRQVVIDFSQEASIELFELVLRAAQLLKELLIGCNDLEILLVLKETSRYFGVPLELCDILLDGILNASVLVG